MRKIFLFLFLMTLFTLKVNAEACDAYDIKRLKEIADGVEITYEQLAPYDNGGFMVYDTYKIKIVGLTDEMYIYDNLNDKLIYYSDTDNGKIEYTSFYNGKNSFYINSRSCPDKLGTRNITLPYYNYRFYGSKECEKLNYSISYCNEYVDERFTEELFFEVYNSYLNKSIKKSNYKHYAYFIFASVLVFGLVFILVKKKKAVLS